ncbi:serine/threonine protein kinase [Gaeumannomyces tritici R3-111a-1]|uniref:Serine/threonine protein kinase n=1 Tax=Gaeumannomyces tritici (strain R3-111a-1) TaxID=644352 RepID=J3PDW4_GAET3|nr:serine/threonine protein kinase [Gaeumannomyces tritici R3-111a-1]EJT70664.1 serine/threonine protein kinase [Gaeumannomyces tritici R3-111a-1]
MVKAEESPGYEARSVAMNHAHLANARLFAVPERRFWLQGPNGRHLCLVFPVLGLDLSRLSQGLYARLNSEFARQVSLQVAQGLALLHSLGLCHGDSQTSWCSQDGLSWNPLGEPPEPHAPKYVVAPLDLRAPATVNLFTGEVCIIDFDQSFATASGPAQGSWPGTPLKYLAPEACVGRPLSPASDIWALGCAIFRLRKGDDIFYDWDTNCPADALTVIAEVIGELPEDWAQTRFNYDGFLAEDDEPGDPYLPPDTARPLEGHVRGIVDEPASLFISADGRLVDPADVNPPSPIMPEWHPLREPYPPPLRSMVWKPTAICVAGNYSVAYSSGGETEKMLEAFPKIPEREADLLFDLLSKIFIYDPDKRLTAEEVVAHPWFRFSE